MKKNVTGIIITFAALILLAVSLIFQCSPMEDGTYMNCHKASLTVAVLSFAIAALGLLSIIVKEEGKKLILLGAAGVISFVNAMIPGIIISLCMMPEMTCRALLRPTTIFCSLIICLSALTGFSYMKKVKA
jgi:ABC-type uncharacterized transport system permease subunit